MNRDRRIVPAPPTATHEHPTDLFAPVEEFATWSFGAPCLVQKVNGPFTHVKSCKHPMSPARLEDSQWTDVVGKYRDVKVLRPATCTELHALLELVSAFWRLESRRGQFRLQEELSMREKALRETQIRNFHEMGEMKRAQELRVDEFSVQKLRESQETQYKGSHHKCRKCKSRRIQVNFKWNRISQWEIVLSSQSTSSDSKFSFYAEPRQTLAT